MKATELMIGDWVYDGILKGNTKVAKLDKNQIKGDTHIKFHDEESFTPIPLTSGFFQTNGFELLCDDVWYLKHKGLKPIHAKFFQNGTIVLFINCDLIPMELKYIHQFQHALRLCGLTELADNFKV